MTRNIFISSFCYSRLTSFLWKCCKEKKVQRSISLSAPFLSDHISSRLLFRMPLQEDWGKRRGRVDEVMAFLNDKEKRRKKSNDCKNAQIIAH